jgi:hypothetical protein
MTAIAVSVCAAEWYPFVSSNAAAPGPLGLSDWSTEPAGAHGRIVSREGTLFYEGREIKLWGLNNCYLACAPEKELADQRAALYRKFGFNAIRLHKYADGADWNGILVADSAVEFDPEKLRRMDYYISVLKQNGIYTKLSPTFGVKIGRADVPRIPFFSELGTLGDASNARLRAPYGMVYLSTEIQDLQIEQTTKILNHTNPYTGLRYADDPAVFCVELFNEDSVLFGGVVGSLQRSPTLRERTARRFSEWLLAKYQSEAAWRAAWGNAAIYAPQNPQTSRHLMNMIKPESTTGPLAEERLADRSVLPWHNPWFGDTALDPASETAVLKQRMLDTICFLIELQNEFYDRFSAAIRATGYTGEIVGSNWQAGSLAGHLLNLHSDARLTIVDRHNYFGGGRGGLKGEPFGNGSMLAIPGMGILSSGLQQVEGRPFMLSEWIHEAPNEFVAEGPAILGAYAYGLQGWDVSYIFQNGDNGGFSPTLGKDRWDVTAPTILGVMPAVARMVRRLDVQESPVTATLHAALPALKKGDLGFRQRTIQAHDEKSFTTDKVPMEALAATRVAVQFSDTFQETPAFDLSDYLDGSTIVSATRQLRWTPGGEGDSRSGFFTINSPGTKGFVGFAPGEQTFDLGDGYSITPQKGFAVILLTAKGPNETLANASELVVIAMARARNTEMQFNSRENQLMNKGKAPILCEPVRATIALPVGGTLELLDHDGVKTTASRTFTDTLELNGTEDKTPFYLIKKSSSTRTKTKIIVETDLGGDRDDQESLIRLLLHSNELDIRTIICDRPGEQLLFKKDVNASNPDPSVATNGVAMAHYYIDRGYAPVVDNLRLHDPAFPSADTVRSWIVAGYPDVMEGRDRIIAEVDALPEGEVLWYMNWGSNVLEALDRPLFIESNLKRALDYIRAERGEQGVRAFLRKIRIVTLDGNSNRYGKLNTRLGDEYNALIREESMHIETGWPTLDGKRWYHRFQPLTQNAGGFQKHLDLSDEHGPLAQLYSALGQKEGDSWCFVYLLPFGVGDPFEPTWGGLAGRYGPRQNTPDTPPSAQGVPFYWNDQLDTWNGTTHRDNTVVRFAAALQNAFRARLDWCVLPFEAVNHDPIPTVTADGQSATLGILRLRRPAGSVLQLMTTVCDPDQEDRHTFNWVYYPEAGTYTGPIEITRPDAADPSVIVPEDAAGRQIHLYVEVTDNGSRKGNRIPDLTRYCRVVIDVTPVN